MDGAAFFMNLNEECLLQFLNNPGRLELSTVSLKKFIFSLNDNIIINEDAIRKKYKLMDA